MGEDEEGTLNAFNARLAELIEACITEHKGRIVKTTGDGLLVAFAGVVDAVHCADSVVLMDGAPRASSLPRPRNPSVRGSG